MGEHNAPDPSLGAKLYSAGRKVWANRRRIAAAAIVALPFASRYIPGFPSAEIVAVLRMFLGA